MKTFVGMAVMFSLVLSALFLAGCQTPTQRGAVIGGASGAALGAIIGNQSGKRDQGALIGGAAGALTGALIGDAVDERRDKKAQEAQAAGTPPQSTQAGSTPPARGHWETRVVRTDSGETYSERVWVEDK